MASLKLYTDICYWKTLKFFLIFILCNFAISSSFAQLYSFEAKQYTIKDNKEDIKNRKTYSFCKVETNNKTWEVETDARINGNKRFKSGTTAKGAGATFLLLKTSFTNSKIKRIIVNTGTSVNNIAFLKGELKINNKPYTQQKPLFNENPGECSILFNEVDTNGNMEIKLSFEKEKESFIIIKSIEIVNEINEKEDNYTTITNNKEIKGNSIQINRTLSKDYWNTLCLPFNVNKESVNLLLNNPELKEFTKEVDGTTMKFRNADSIKAGIPYIIKPSKDVVNPTFRNVIVTATEPKIITDNQSKNYSFIGTYSPTDLKTDGTELFLGDKDYLYKPFANDKTINGMRAFFRIKNNTSQARQSQYNIAIDETTFISLPNISITPPTTKEKIYTLDGRQVRSTHNLKADIYIKNGKKLYVR